MKMREFAELVQWPAAFTAVVLLTNDKYCSAIVILALVFRHDLSAVIRHRRLSIKWPGFQGDISGKSVPPSRRKKTPLG
jgi:hypothetical protein